jgi:hypothetical protein
MSIEEDGVAPMVIDEVHKSHSISPTDEVKEVDSDQEKKKKAAQEEATEDGREIMGE